MGFHAGVRDLLAAARGGQARAGGPRDRRSSPTWRTVLAERDFRRLFGTRLVSQAGDGMFTAGLGTYVFFNATSFPNPVSAASAFAVLYLPYSLIGPFAGVFIDRWSRRQILVWSALVRGVFVALTASLVASGSLGVPLYAGVLAVLGVNRFFLSSLSAALPHVVAEDKLVMANSVAPTCGTIVSFIGGFIGLGVHLATGGGRGGSAVTLLVAGRLLPGGRGGRRDHAPGRARAGPARGQGARTRGDQRTADGRGRPGRGGAARAGSGAGPPPRCWPPRASG